MSLFVDTNVFIHFLLEYDPQRLERCRQLLAAAENGEIDLETSDMVIAEIVWFLERPPIRMKPNAIRDRLLPLIGLPGLRLPDKNFLGEAFQTYVERGVNFIDAYNAAVMRRRRIDRIYSYDSDFDRLPGLTRLEP